MVITSYGDTTDMGIELVGKNQGDMGGMGWLIVCVVVIFPWGYGYGMFFLNQPTLIWYLCFLKNADTPTHIYFNAENSGLIEWGIAFSDENMLVGKSMEWTKRGVLGKVLDASGFTPGFFPRDCGTSQA